MQFIGVDLAWGEGKPDQPANETGLVVIDEQGTVEDATWSRGIDATVEWLTAVAEPGAVIAVDAPLVITNAKGNRLCESEVARCYGRWQVFANSSNTTMAAQAGVALRQRLEELGFEYLDGSRPARADRRSFFECYPYTTIVGMWELGYEVERPRYKRLVPKLPGVEAKELRAKACDDLLRRMAALAAAETPLNLASHSRTAQLLDEPSPVLDRPYKHREDLIDAALAAWTAAIWHQTPLRTQVLGASAGADESERRPTIVAPFRPEQRLSARAAARPVRTSRERPTEEPSLERALTTVRQLLEVTASLTTRLRVLEQQITTLAATESPRVSGYGQAVKLESTPSDYPVANPGGTHPL